MLLFVVMLSFVILGCLVVFAMCCWLCVACRSRSLFTLVGYCCCVFLAVFVYFGVVVCRMLLFGVACWLNDQIVSCCVVLSCVVCLVAFGCCSLVVSFCLFTYV